MEIKKAYLNRKKSWSLLVGIILLSFIFNLENIHMWAQQKSVSKITLIILKFTDSFNYLGQELGLNLVTKQLRSSFNEFKTADYFQLNQIRNVAGEPLSAVNPLLADVPDLELPESDERIIDELVESSPSTSSADEESTRILLLGDSMLKSGLQMHLQTKLHKQYPEADVIIKSQSGTGLSRPEIFNWIDYVNTLSATYEDIYVFLGTNDAQNFVIDKKIYAFGSDEWAQEYASRVSSLLNTACEKAKNVFWVGSLRMRSESFDKKMSILNSIVKSEVKKNKSCGKYISTQQWITEKNNYVDHMTIDKKTQKVRMEDGIHLSYWGALLFSEKLIEHAGKQKTTN